MAQREPEATKVALLQALKQFCASPLAGAERARILRSARARGVKITAQDLQRAADDFRAACGLHKAADTARWFRSQRVSLGQFQDYLTVELARAAGGPGPEGVGPTVVSGHARLQGGLERPRLRRDIRVDRYLSDDGEPLVSITDVLLNGRDSNKQVCLPQALWQVARLCDGQSDPAAIAGRARSHLRVRIGVDVVRATIATLDEHCLLDNERSRERLEEQGARLGREPTRRTAADVLPGDAAELRAALKACMSASLGPGIHAPPPRSERLPPLRAAVSPHALLNVSGPCAAHVYAELAASQLPDIVVVVGYNHLYNDNTIELLLKDTLSPLGRLRVAREFGEVVCSLAGNALSQDGLALYHEHSIDLQVPWLQSVAELRNAEILYLPIILSNVPRQADARLALAFRHKIKRVVRAVREAARRLHQAVCIIASGDFAHAGPFYGSPPVSDQDLARLTAFDMRAIQLILDGRSDEFYRMTVGTTYCCPGPVYFLLEAMENPEARLLKYYTTWDAGMRGENINSFAAISFR